MSDFVAVAKRRVGWHQKIDFPIRELRDTAAYVLHRMMEHRRRLIRLLEGSVSLFESSFDISPLELVFEKEIGSLLFVHKRCSRTESLNAVIDIRQRVIGDI